MPAVLIVAVIFALMGSAVVLLTSGSILMTIAFYIGTGTLTLTSGLIFFVCRDDTDTSHDRQEATLIAAE